MSNPDMMNQAMQMMSGGGGGMNMSQMMSNPSMQNLIKKPRFSFKHSQNAKRPKQLENDVVHDGRTGKNMNIGMFIKVLEFLERLSRYARTVKEVASHKITKLVIFAIIVLVIAYYFNS